MPLASNGALVFGNWGSIEAASDTSFKAAAAHFRGAGRAVRLLYGHRSLPDILAAHGGPILAFARMLKELSDHEPYVKDYLQMHNRVEARQRTPGKGDPLRHTLELLLDLISKDDWDDARDLAERTIDVSRGTSRVKVARILALCLARSTERTDRERASILYGEVVKTELAEPDDYGALATLMMELGCYDEAKGRIRDGIARFPDHTQAFTEVGMRLVQACGDRDFRDWLIGRGTGA